MHTLRIYAFQRSSESQANKQEEKSVFWGITTFSRITFRLFKTCQIIKRYVDLEKASEEGTQRVRRATTNLTKSELNHSILCNGWSVLTSCAANFGRIRLRRPRYEGWFQIYRQTISISGASVRWVAAILFRPGYVYSFQGRYSKVSVNKINPNCLILLSNWTKSNPNLSVSTGTELNPT